MNIFKKKDSSASQYRVLTDDYRPAKLPVYGQSLHTFITATYSMVRPEILKKWYQECEEELSKIIESCDEHCKGNEADHYIDGQYHHMVAQHKVEVAAHEHQVKRIIASRTTRTEMLKREEEELTGKIGELETSLEPLKDLRSLFQIRLGSVRIPIGPVITILAMLVDAVLNYSFLQNVLLSNTVLLLITVICMSLMSDGSMMALGIYLSHRKEKFTPKPVYYTVCGGLLTMFLLSVIASVMIRYGSMDSTFGTINVSGQFVAKETYSLADHGVTLITSFITTCTGLLSFGFSSGDNDHLISLRESLQEKLNNSKVRLTLVCAELSDLAQAPDPMELDLANRKAAEENIDALRLNLKLHLRKMMTISQNDATFTERMADSGSMILESDHGHTQSPITAKLTKAS